MAVPQAVTFKTEEPRYLLYLLPVWFFGAFLTKVKFVPMTRHNVGPFEGIGLIALVLFILLESRRTPIRGHPIIRVTLAIFVLAALSQVWLSPTRTFAGLTQVTILFYLLLFLTLFHSWSRRYHLSPELLLTIVTCSILVVGPWVMIQGIAGDPLTSVGPFRNRAHMAAYMLTCFWLVLVHALWPRLAAWKRLACYSGLALTLYAIAASGRRSVYLSLFFGLVGLAVAFLAAHRGKRVHLIFAGVFVIGFLGFLYAKADNLTEQTAFFKKRIAQVDDRVREAVGWDNEYDGHKGFLELQREGVLMAFRESPILGIGWGGFAKSRFSPTGHEVHSMPLRFLAELGLVGLLLYLLFMATLLLGSARLFLRMRRTPYGGSYLALVLGLWTMVISYAYNRHMTERTFWILVAIYLSLDLFASDYERISQLAREHLSEEAEEALPPADGVLQPASARVLPSPQAQPANRLRLLPGARPEPTS